MEHVPRVYRDGYWFSLRRYTSDEPFLLSRARESRVRRYPIEDTLVSANRADVTYDRNVSRCCSGQQAAS